MPKDICGDGIKVLLGNSQEKVKSQNSGGQHLEETSKLRPQKVKSLIYFLLPTSYFLLPCICPSIYIGGKTILLLPKL